MRAPRRRSWPSGCARTPRRSCGPTATAAVARLTGSQTRRVGSTGLRRRNAQLPGSAQVACSAAEENAAPSHLHPALLPGSRPRSSSARRRRDRLVALPRFARGSSAALGRLGRSRRVSVPAFAPPPRRRLLPAALTESARMTDESMRFRARRSPSGPASGRPACARLGAAPDRAAPVPLSASTCVVRRASTRARYG